MIRRPGAILALLTGLNLLNYLDRLVVSAVLPKVQESLHLSNFQGGLLATVFLVGYFATSPIFGSLGDRVARKGLIAIGVLVWSAATIASGLANDLWTLLLARAAVGVGEASYATLAPTIIDDVTPPHRKGRALATFYIAIPVGSALGYLVGGFVEARWGWRNAFFVAGVPGVLLALLCLAIAEPERKLAAEKANLLRDVRALASMDLYRKGVLGYCAFTAAIGAFSFWAPKFLYARYAVPLAGANFKFGRGTGGGGAVGTLIGGRWADRKVPAAESRGADDHKGAGYRDESPETKAAREREATRAHVHGLLRICATGAGIGTPIMVVCFLSPSPTVFFGLALLGIVALFLSTSPINAVILHAVPSELRASAMALSIFSIHVFGDLWSPPLVGLLADHLPIEVAMMTLPFAVALATYVWWPRRSPAERPAS